MLVLVGATGGGGVNRRCDMTCDRNFTRVGGMTCVMDMSMQER